MDFTFTEDQLAFREAISRFLMTEAPPETLREIWETEDGRSPEMRRKMAEQGLTALSVPEAQGGLGMDDIAWSLLTQELGYYAIADSMADTAYVATGLLAALPAGTGLRDELLARIVDGDVRIAVGHPVNPLVADVHLADVVLQAHQGEIHALKREHVSFERNPSIDSSRRLSRVSFQPGDATRLVGAEQGSAIWDQTLNRGALAVAGQSLGLAQRMLDLSVDYAVQRKQFGKAIGSFQAVKHKLADVAGKIEFAKPVLYRAAHALANNEPTAALNVSHAKLACCEAAWVAARHGIQVHGAMGYTWEVDLQMFMKRAWALDSSWGDRAFHTSRVAEAVLAADAPIGPHHSFGATDA
ncbi:putative acyl-CoA dehydrogenase FadE [Halopseudomonas aestusnigri]|uniref:acyl-CoA dehydrogenase family protein n=1 Tax=Halopseudomonas TaxID=2901189 RepID=UPI0022B5E924|nr:MULTISPECIES: acyl-CoA dehydrogenase family protein [Halopseudomonas]BDX20124.1 putative acyl-CoA dehydrogenase FadE [Halopseudomonas aestusnigri]